MTREQRENIALAAISIGSILGTVLIWWLR